MQQLLMHCNDIYLNTDCCHNESDRECNCRECLSSGFYGRGDDSYSCLKRLSVYTMNYGPAYVSELYHFFSASQLLEINFNNSRINVLSLGCGFSPDLIALNKYITTNSLNIGINYTGIDVEDKWNQIRTGDLGHCLVQDVLNGFDFSGYEIVFVNKIFSTLKSKNQDDAFLDLLQYQVKNKLANSSFLVFNDVNHRNMGRDKFHGTICQSITSVARYFYNISGAYTGDYSEILNIHNICEIPNNLVISPRREVTKSVIFLYQQ